MLAIRPPIDFPPMTNFLPPPSSAIMSRHDLHQNPFRVGRSAFTRSRAAAACRETRSARLARRTRRRPRRSSAMKGRIHRRAGAMRQHQRQLRIRRSVNEQAGHRCRSSTMPHRASALARVLSLAAAQSRPTRATISLCRSCLSPCACVARTSASSACKTSGWIFSVAASRQYAARYAHQSRLFAGPPDPHN